MQRDNLRDLDYFNERIEFSTMAIEQLEDGLDELIEEKGEDFEGVHSAYCAIAMYALGKIRAQYSRGDDIEDIKETILKYIYNGISSWDNTAGFEELYNILSFSVFVGIDEDLLLKIKAKIKEESVHDAIVDKMVNYLDPSWTIENESVKYPKRFSLLNDVIEGKDHEEKYARLVKYLDKWYRLSSDTAWHDSHKRENDTYKGYWCFEAGAVAKILEIDDSELIDKKYYPYDLVHYTD